MPTLPLEPSPDRARSADPHAVPSAASDLSSPPTAPASEASGTGTSDAAAPAPEAAPTEVERARWRDRRTGLIALIVVTVALWAVIAAAVGFATTM
ncbi:hypothetical protein BFL36_14385 [Clavibacter michiganensis]|uniref:Uncharacterized protein n=1 Tax=Clavibacter michiganensis TaxID=28447 RepID=A0A251Y203_9MICO|nr:hypothetical protein [Clavibacter michiganensis]OUE18337.1 hypothetical protein BFL36_14385 [Clavibacter michiganensis]